MAISKRSSGSIRHLTGLRCAKLEIPVNDHYSCQCILYVCMYGCKEYLLIPFLQQLLADVRRRYFVMVVVGMR